MILMTPFFESTNALLTLFFNNKDSICMAINSNILLSTTSLKEKLS
jgi:hypothetical protein